MRIGLVRHHKVKYPFPKKIILSSSDVLAWFEGYNHADIEPDVVDMRGVEWGHCISSPMKRSLQTARHIFQGEIQIREELTELEARPFLNQNLRLPFLVWALLIRLKTVSNNPHTHAFKNQVRIFIDSIPADGTGDVLVVSHALTMTFMKKELAHRGFHGETFSAPAYGRIYIFEKT